MCIRDRCQLHGRVYLLERYRLTHDVGFEYVALDLHFNREHFHAEAGIIQKYLLNPVMVAMVLYHSEEKNM